METSLPPQSKCGKRAAFTQCPKQTEETERHQQSRNFAIARIAVSISKSTSPTAVVADVHIAARTSQSSSRHERYDLEGERL
jgi:hypothetical protein